MTEGAVKVSLYKAARDLAELTHKIEDWGEEEIDAELVKLFGEGQSELADSIDRRKAFAKRLKKEIEIVEDEIGEAKAFVKRCEKVYERLKATTLATMQTYPEIPFKDKRGQKLSICKASPALELSFELLSKSFKILDIEALEKAGISIGEKYIQQVTFLVLDTDKVRADLTANEILPWAELKQKTFLRGL
jgi:hypothetical protein